MIEAYFVSDIHIREADEARALKFYDFLVILKNTDATHLFLVGDIFDLWIHNHKYFIEKYKKIVNAIKEVVQAGIEVHYFEGNHDLYLLRFWQQEVGVRVHEGPEFFSVGPFNIQVEHGDEMNPDDKGYLFLRSLLRSQPIRWVAKNLPGSVVQKIGHRASLASRSYTSNQKSLHAEQVRSFMRTYADQAFKKRNYDYLITGHTHVLDTYEVAKNSAYSINLGSWFDKQFVLKITAEGHQFVEL